MKVKEESEKFGLKLNIQKTKIMTSSPITSWQADGEILETVADFIFLDFKITEDWYCNHEIKRCLLLGRKVMTNLDSILKSREVTLPIKVHLVKAIVFPVVMYGCKSCTLKKAEPQRIGAFELWCWRRLLRVPWTARRFSSPSEEDQSWVFIGRTDAEAETPILWPPHAKSWLVGKDPDDGRDWGQQEKGTTEDEMAGWHHRLDGHVNSGSWLWTGRPGVLWFMGSQGVTHDWLIELNWTELELNLQVIVSPYGLCFGNFT